MHRSSRRTRGTSLLEVLVASAILAIGIVATFQCLGAISAAQQRALDSEKMQRLALQTLDDLIAEQSLPSGQNDGDFLSQGEPRFIWHAEREPSGIGSLDILRVEVGVKGDNFTHAAKIQTLLCRPSSGGSS